MKYKFKILVTILLSFLVACEVNAQLKENLISRADYDAITFNGKTIFQANGTKGDARGLNALFGNPDNVNKIAVTTGKVFYYGVNFIGFIYEEGFINGRVGRLEINDATWTLVIKGQRIRVGDSEASLKQKFGSDFQIFTSEYNDDRFTGVNYSDNDFDGVDIKINPTTKKIIQITYFVIP